MSSIKLMDAVVPRDWDDLGMDWKRPNPRDWKYWAALFMARSERIAGYGYTEGYANGIYMTQHLPIYTDSRFIGSFSMNRIFPLFDFNISNFIDTSVALDIDSMRMYPRLSYATLTKMYPECDWKYIDIGRGDPYASLVPVMKAMRKFLMRLRYKRIYYGHAMLECKWAGPASRDWHGINDDHTGLDDARTYIVGKLDLTNLNETENLQCEHSISHDAQMVHASPPDPDFSAHSGYVSGMKLSIDYNLKFEAGISPYQGFTLHYVIASEKQEKEDNVTVWTYPSVPFEFGKIYDVPLEDYKLNDKVEMVSIDSDTFPPLPSFGSLGYEGVWHKNVYKLDLSLTGAYADMQSVYNFKCDEF